MSSSGARRKSGKSAFIGVLLLCLAGVWILCRVFVDGASGIDGSTNVKRIEYIESYGWKTGTVPSAIEEIRIPARFDEAYEQYNALQKEQGFNLKRYAAAKAQKFTYRLSEYDGADPIIPINANLIVVNGEIVGADISSSEANGFVTVLAKSQN